MQMNKKLLTIAIVTDSCVSKILRKSEKFVNACYNVLSTFDKNLEFVNVLTLTIFYRLQINNNNSKEQITETIKTNAIDWWNLLQKIAFSTNNSHVKCLAFIVALKYDIIDINEKYVICMYCVCVCLCLD